MWFIRQDPPEWCRSEAMPELGAAVLERGTAGDAILIAPFGAGIIVNGAPVVNGIHVLAHKDEISGPDGILAYFSTEALPEAVAFSGPTVKCGRCRTLIEQNAWAVRCLCGVFYHLTDPPCFEHGDEPKCVACGRPTRLDGSGLWVPEADE